MKKHRKIQFGKTTIAKLNTNQLSKIRGAGTIENCDTVGQVCETIRKTKLGGTVCGQPPVLSVRFGCNRTVVDC